ncbi:MAG: hypothetical protein SGJ27_01170 [Candidatus Melainabacteria bacterium]|nr:hypothetical protein [Candidatus Melainabacteria bacterium]
MNQSQIELKNSNAKFQEINNTLSAAGFSKTSEIQRSSRVSAYQEFLKKHLSHVNMRLDSPDESWVQFDNSEVVIGHFSIWYCDTPLVNSKTTGFIGHYYAKNTTVGKQLLNLASKLLKQFGCQIAVGPVDGNTWRNYRLVSGTTDVPRFILEPQNPLDYPAHFIDASFDVLATYSSSILDAKPDFIELETITSSNEVAVPLDEVGDVVIRPIDLENFERELLDIYGIACDAFADNFLYSEISEFEFLARYKPLLPLVVPDLMLIAEYEQHPVGFVLAVPDPANSNCTLKTAVVKTIGRIQDDRFRGLGRRLMAEVHQRAEKLGFTSLIHALYKDDNTSSIYSTIHGAQVFRQYAVYGKHLD